jgi:hypothetical protein
MSATAEQKLRFQTPGIIAALWAGIVLGPIAWAFDLQLSYALTYKACSTGKYFILYIVSFSTMIVALGGALISYSVLVRARAGEDEGGHGRDRAHFMARMGLYLSLAFVIVIIAQAVPRFMLSPCD